MILLRSAGSSAVVAGRERNALLMFDFKQNEMKKDEEKKKIYSEPQMISNKANDMRKTEERA